jgi:hypothetical protein
MKAARSARRTVMRGSAGVVVDRLGFAGSSGSARDVVAGATV